MFSDLDQALLSALTLLRRSAMTTQALDAMLRTRGTRQLEKLLVLLSLRSRCLSIVERPAA